MIIKSKLIKVIAALLLLTVASCKKKAAEPTQVNQQPSPSYGVAEFHFHTNLDTNEVDTYNYIYTVQGGRRIALSIAQLYVSGIQLVKSDGSTYDVPNVNLLKLMQVEEYLVGSVPTGNYKSVRFNVGLAPSTNTMTPAVNDSTLNHANMWFGSAAQPGGYVFLNMQGKIDTATVPSSTITLAQMQPFTYRIGTDAHLKNVSMPDQNFSIEANAVHFIHITIDYNKLFTGIALNVASNLMVNTAADNSSALSTQITNNIPLMFSYEQ